MELSRTRALPAGRPGAVGVVGVAGAGGGGAAQRQISHVILEYVKDSTSSGTTNTEQAYLRRRDGAPRGSPLSLPPSPKNTSVTPKDSSSSYTSLIVRLRYAEAGNLRQAGTPTL